MADSKADRQKKFYHQQRIKAEETGDQATTDKIYKKLGRKSHSVDAEAVNKGILGGVASTMGLRGLGKIGKAARAGRAASSLSGDSPKAISGGKTAIGSTVRKHPLKALRGGKGPPTVGSEPIVTTGVKAKGSTNKPIYKTKYKKKKAA